MELKYLKTFHTIIETGSFVKAAKKLNYTQSTVTFQIQQLEKELSIQLFEKIGRNKVVTQSGKAIIPLVNKILNSMLELEHYGESVENLTEDLNVVVPESLLTYKIQPILERFREQAPKVNLTIKSMNCYQIKEDIEKGYADLGIHYDVDNYNSSIVLEALETYDVVLVKSAKLYDIHEIKDFSDKGKEMCLLINDRDSIYHKMMVDYLKHEKLHFKEMMEVGSIETIKRCVISNLGIAYLPRFVVEEELNYGSLVEIPTRTNHVQAMCIYRKNQSQTLARDLFLKLTKAYF